MKEGRIGVLGGTIHASGAPAATIPAGRSSIVVGGEREKLQCAVEFLKDAADTVICLPEPILTSY